MTTINQGIKFLQTNGKLLFRSYCHFDIRFAAIKYGRILGLRFSETSSLSGKNSHWFFLLLNLMSGFSILWQLAFQKAKRAWKFLLGYLTSSPACQTWEIFLFFSFCLLQCYAVSQYGGPEFQRIVSTHCKVDNAESLVPMATIMCDWKEMLNVFFAQCPSHFTLVEVLERQHMIVGYSSNYINLSDALIGGFLCSCTKQ